MDPQPLRRQREPRGHRVPAQLNAEVYRDHPDAQTIAEESTAWPLVSRPTYVGGLGFGLKWDMGWMHDTLEYFQQDPIHRKYHQGDLTFRMLYAFSENFVLPLSHDEVVHGKGSLLDKMPGDDWQQFANLRAALRLHVRRTRARSCSSWAASSASGSEWNHDDSLDWHLLDYPPHARHAALGRATSTALYRNEPALYELRLLPTTASSGSTATMPTRAS